MTSSSDIDYSQFCAGCELPSVVRCGNCWKGGKGRKVGYCGAAHQKQMWVSHKPYCGIGEGSKAILYFQTPLSEQNFHDFVSDICTSKLDPRFLETLSPAVCPMFQSLVGRRIIEDGNLDFFRARWADMYYDREEYEFHHDTANIRLLLTMLRPDSNVTPLETLYGLAPPTSFSMTSDLWRRVTSPYYFAMLDLNTIMLPSNKVKTSKAKLQSLWGRVSQTVQVMKLAGYERFVPEVYPADNDFYQATIAKL